MKLLFRQSLAEPNELSIASKYFDVTKYRTACKDELVIPRYSALPYYDELEHDLKSLNCTLLNTHKMHKWIADFEYYNILKKYTPESWTENNFHECQYQGPFVVKGKTNSKKFEWNSSMFANTKKDAIEVAHKLWNDSYIGSQEIIFRKYIPLKTYEIGLNGLPFSNEWRFFFLHKQMLSYGYYWSCADLDFNKLRPPSGCLGFAQKIANIVSNYVIFFVLDVAQTENDELILIEINDGQMSGLSENNPDTLYHNLKFYIDKTNK
jgi:hypothetical protein